MADSIFEGGGGGTPAGADTEIQYNNSGAFGASSDLVFDNTAKTFKVMSSANNLLLVDAATGDYGLGDLDGIGNSTRLFIDDTTKAASIAAGGDRMRLDIDGTAFTGKLGDTGAVGNSTLLTIDDANQILTFASGGATKMSLDVANDIYQIGNLAGSGVRGRLYVDGANGIAALRSFSSGTGITSFIQTTQTGLSFSTSDANRSASLSGTAGANVLSAQDTASADTGSVGAYYNRSELYFIDGAIGYQDGVQATTRVTKVGDFNLLGNSTLITVNDTQQRVTINNRFETDKGADVTAANDLTLGGDGNLFVITGNTQINAITTANRQAGSMITLIFTGTPTVKHNTAGGAGTAVLFLAGSLDLVAANNTVLGLIYDGTQRQETFRKVA